MHTCNPTTQEAEAGRYEFEVSLGYLETLSQNGPPGPGTSDWGQGPGHFWRTQVPRNACCVWLSCAVCHCMFPLWLPAKTG
jgi:hypothetical protein